VEAATGKIQWSERAVRSGKFFSSPVAANGIIYCIDSNGKMIVMRGNGKFEILAENDLDQRCNATPAIADNVMYIRTYTELIAIAK
jgi:outer membrane protein assembly factor BamB